MKTNIAAIAILVLASLAAPSFAAPGGGGGGLPATSGPAVDPNKAFADGVEALKAKDYAKAEKKFGDVLSVAPTHPEANYYMALAKIGVGKEKQATRYLEKAIKARGNFVEARERLALIKAAAGDADAAREQLAAIEALKAECATTGDCDEAFVARVDVAISKIGEALAPKPATPDAPATPAAPETSAPAEEGAGSVEETDEQALLFAPREKGASFYVAAVKAINQQKFADAIADLERARAVVGPHPDILNYLGYANRKLGRMEIAEAYYGEALALDPDHRGANEYLGELYLEIGDLPKARAQLARLDRICAFGCAEREDLARLVALKETDRRAAK